MVNLDRCIIRGVAWAGGGSRRRSSRLHGTTSDLRRAFDPLRFCALALVNLQHSAVLDVPVRQMIITRVKPNVLTSVLIC